MDLTMILELFFSQFLLLACKLFMGGTKTWNLPGLVETDLDWMKKCLATLFMDWI